MPFFLQPLIPIYLAITTNFLALQGVVGHFPTGEAFGGGAFDAIGLDIIFHGARNVSDVSGRNHPALGDQHGRRARSGLTAASSR